MKEQESGGLRLRQLDNGNIQIYARRRDRAAHLNASTANNYAWRLVAELTPSALSKINEFAAT